MNLKVWLILVLTLLVLQTGRADEKLPRFTVIGSFSNMRFTEEHQYGSEVQLWREGTNLFGLFLYSEGLMGDTPTGLLEKVGYDPATGMISFMSKLTTGQHFCKVHKGVPSHDLFSFQGKLSNSSVSGVLQRSDALHPESSPIEEKVVLKKSNEQGIIQDIYRSRSEWETATKEILKVRGPKW